MPRRLEHLHLIDIHVFLTPQVGELLGLEEQGKASLPVGWALPPYP